MILDTTYTNKEQKNIINQLIGKPFSFLEMIKLGGVGSKRMIIEDVSPNMQKYIKTFPNYSYANIEMRSGGIGIHINKGLSSYVWIIPFYQLVIYKTNGTSIHGQGKYIHFRNNITFKENKSFFVNLLNAKIKFDEQYSFQNI